MARQTKISPGLKLTEREVARQVKDFLGLHGWRCIRMNSALVGRPQGGAFRVGEPGMPDYLFLRYSNVYDPKMHMVRDMNGDLGKLATDLIWVEVKRPGGQVSGAQVNWIAEERLRGAIIAVVDDIDEFREWYRREIG